MKKNILAFCLSILATAAFAQSGTNSPYSQYGLGVLTDQGNSYNRGMNGVGLGLRESNQINYINPASYSSIDSLTFVFDVGMSLQITNFKEGNVKKNAKNADFEYAVGGFRLMPKVGLAFGIIPFTNIGYNDQSTGTVNRDDISGTTTYTNTYSGEGGLHEAFVGLGWQPVKGVSLGVNGGYLWGNCTRTVSNAYSDSYVNTLSKTMSFDVTNYKVNFGVQLSRNLSAKDLLTLGATYSIGHKLNADPTLDIVSTNHMSLPSVWLTHTTTALPWLSTTRCSSGARCIILNIMTLATASLPFIPLLECSLTDRSLISVWNIAETRLDETSLLAYVTVSEQVTPLLISKSTDWKDLRNFP